MKRACVVLKDLNTLARAFLSHFLCPLFVVSRKLTRKMVISSNFKMAQFQHSARKKISQWRKETGHKKDPHISSNKLSLSLSFHSINLTFHTGTIKTENKFKKGHIISSNLISQRSLTFAENYNPFVFRFKQARKLQDAQAEKLTSLQAER